MADLGLSTQTLYVVNTLTKVAPDAVINIGDLPYAGERRRARESACMRVCVCVCVCAKGEGSAGSQWRCRGS